MPLEDLINFFNQIDEKDYRAKQLMQWIYSKHIFDFDLMTNFNLELRNHLNQNCSLSFDDAVRNDLSDDGTQKWLIEKKMPHLRANGTKLDGFGERRNSKCFW